MCAKTYLKILKKEKPLGYEKYQRLCQMCREGEKFPNHEMMTCRAGKSSFWINWKGEMSPCFALEGQKVDVSKIGFRRSWERIREYVNNVKLSEKCISCEKQELCISCAGRAFSETGKEQGCAQYICKYMNNIFKFIDV